MTENTIGEHVLRAIAAILAERAPDLIPIIQRLVEENDAEPSSGMIGESAHGSLSGSVPMIDGERILKVLVDYIGIHGEAATVDGWQLNMIVHSWRQFALPRDASPKQ